MDEETDREFSLERQAYQKGLYSLFPKFNWIYQPRFISGFIEQFNPAVKERVIELAKEAKESIGSFFWSGSVMEGAFLVRNLNPNLSKKYHEVEIDLMMHLTKILRSRSREVIVDLEYAKGFVWIKYEPECFDSPEKLDKFLIKHEDGNTYLNSKAVKDVLRCNEVGPSHDLWHSFQEMIEGPSANAKLDIRIEYPSDATVIEAIKTCNECVSFIKNASEHLEKLHCDVLSKLKELEKLIQGKCELISTTDAEELASVVLPVQKERQNILLKVHWMLLAFVNETLSTILTIDKMLPKKDLLDSLGILGILCPFNVELTPLSIPKKLFEDLDSYFKYLLYLMPSEVYEKYNENPLDGLFHFFQKCLYCRQDEMEKLFKVFCNYKSTLLRTCVWLEFFHGYLKDKFDFTDKINKVSASFDQVPAIAVEDFPYIATEWVTRDRTWPSLSVVKDIVMSGCHIVPKPYYGEEGDNLLDWRWSFSLAEIILASHRTRKMDLSYLILKSIFYRYLKPIEYKNETLPSYLVKTVMLWQCEENDETWWSDKSMVKCISVLLNRLKMSFFNKHLPHYFIHEINLFDNVIDELVLYGQAVLESICADPIICIEEVLEFYDTEETETDNETMTEKFSESKLKLPLLLAEAQEQIKLAVEKYKAQQPAMKILGRPMKLLFEKLVPYFFSGVPTSSFLEENDLLDSHNFFDDFIKAIESVFSDTFDIPLD